MKRFIFSVCALAAVVVGCTKSEVINRPHAEEPIQFNPYLGRIPVTKATAANKAVLGEEGFQVYAFIHEANKTPDYSSNVYMNKVVTQNKEGNWTYSGNAYWPATAELDFIAYGLNAEDLITPNETQKNLINFKVPSTVAEQKDLLVAKIVPNMVYAEGTGANNGVVNFTFSHLLSRVGFSLVTKENNGVNVTIEKIDLVGDFYKEGEVDLILTQAQATSLTINGQAVTDNRPYITPATETLGEVTYSLLPASSDNAPSFTSTGSKDGSPIFDNSILWTKNLGEDQNSSDDDRYESNFPDANNPEKHNDKADGYEDANNVAKANEANRYMMIIPVAGATHKAELNVAYFLPGAGTFTIDAIDLSDINFEAGKSYDFKLKVSTNGISFDVTVEDWDVTMEGTDKNPVINLK